MNRANLLKTHNPLTEDGYISIYNAVLISVFSRQK